MSGYSYKDYSISDLKFSTTTKKENKKISELTRVSDFYSADFDAQKRILSFSGWDDYETIKRFFKKLVAIKSDIHDVVTIEDKAKDTYWLIRIDGKQITELFGVVFWGTKEEQAKIKAVLRAHLKTTEEKLNEITAQVTLALRGEYDDLDDINEEETESLEELSEEEKKQSGPLDNEKKE